MSLKKNIIVLSVLFAMLISVFSGSLVVNAIDNNSARAIETYTRSVTIQCGPVGSTDVKLTISHNATIGKSWVSAITHKDTINKGYVTAKINSVSTEPAKGTYFTGRISIKVKVKYTNAGKSIEVSDYVNS